MSENFLSRNLQRYPRLADLFLTDVTKQSSFLMSISIDMQRKPLTDLQAFKACKAIVERTGSEVRAQRQRECSFDDLR
jgi:hypothetical protein